MSNITAAKCRHVIIKDIKTDHKSTTSDLSDTEKWHKERRVIGDEIQQPKRSEAMLVPTCGSGKRRDKLIKRLHTIELCGKSDLQLGQEWGALTPEPQFEQDHAETQKSVLVCLKVLHKNARKFPCNLFIYFLYLPCTCHCL